IHPECGCLTPYLDRVVRQNGSCALRVASTEGMIKRAAESSSDEFVVGTEIGILDRLKYENPSKIFYPIDDEMSCTFIKIITLEEPHRSPTDDGFAVTVSKDVADKARLAIERMISIF